MDAVLLGRKTCEQGLGFGKWPYEDKRCWVFSRQKFEALPPLAAVTTDRPREVMREMERARLRRAGLVGGGALAGAFHAEGLIAAHIISVVPVMLGKGIQPFGGNGAHERLMLVESQRYATGIVELRHVRDK